jgi:hypothetical protein
MYIYADATLKATGSHQDSLLAFTDGIGAIVAKRTAAAL